MKHAYFILGCLSSIGLATFNASAQDTYVPLQSEEAHLYQRIEALNNTLHHTDLGSYLPVGRRSLATYLELSKKNAIQSNQVAYSLVDQHTINRALGINGEWVEDASGHDGATLSKKPILKYFYTTKENLFHYDDEDFFVVVNPVLYTQVGMGLNNSDPNTYINFRGAEVRGRIAKRVGFYTLLGDNQEKPFSNIGLWESNHKSFPSNDYYRRLDNGSFDAFVGRGYVTVEVVPNFTTVAFGYDKQFIGNGIRSMIQSNESAASTFLRIKTQVGKIQIDNLYQELVSDFAGLGNDDRLPRKYNSFHQVSKNFGTKLNVALFENTMYGATNKYKITNLFPALITHKLFGSKELDRKTSFGLQFKYLPIRSVQLYGQTMIDYLSFSGHDNPSLPKAIYAGQLGLKYFNAFTVNNLDLQVELNVASDNMYQAGATTRNHTHYNQPLAHSMGNSFTELIGKLKYQPHYKWYIDLTGIFFKGNDNFPAANKPLNIFVPYQQTTTGTPSNNLYANGNIAYELFTNFFIEAGGTYIKGISRTGGYAYGGIRWNISRKQNYIFY